MRQAFGFAGAVVGAAHGILAATPQLAIVLASSAGAMLVLNKLRVFRSALPRPVVEPLPTAGSAPAAEAEAEAAPEPAQKAPKRSWTAKLKLSRQVSSSVEESELIGAVNPKTRGVKRLARQGSAAIKRAFTSKQAQAGEAAPAEVAQL